MPLFRFHKGSLAESLLTTVIVKSKKELLSAINKEYSSDFIKFEGVLVEPYIHEDEFGFFDKRCGWYTQIVFGEYFDINAEKKRNIIGFLSEPME